jgi:tetratricopeptide (TPR) repeat protein
MKRVLTGLAALVLSACATKETPIEYARYTEIPKNEHSDKIIKTPKSDNYYLSGLDYKHKALTEKDELKRAEFIALAVSDFHVSEYSGRHVYDSIIEQADCLSLGNNHKQALETIDRALEMKETPEAYNVKGNIWKRIGANEFAIQLYEKAITLKDNAESHWGIYEANLKLSITKEGIIIEKIQKSLQACEAYVKMEKERPDGYAALGAVQAIIAFATNDEKLLSKANANMSEALRKLEKTPFKHPELDKDALKESYENTRRKDREY